MLRLGIRAGHSCVALVFFLLGLFLPCTTPAQSSSQQYVYANVPNAPPTTSTLAALAKNGQNGSLSNIAGSPFSDRLEGGSLAVDALGRFLFVLNPTSNSISMFQISSAGALTEVPTSPFSASSVNILGLTPSQPVSLATEKSGKYLYVGYGNGDLSMESAIFSFEIDAANLNLTPTSQRTVDNLSYDPLQMFSDPRGLFLYAVNGPSLSTGAPNGGVSVYAIDASTGSLSFNGDLSGVGGTGRSSAIDPQARFFYVGNGTLEGFLSWGLISPLDGTGNTIKGSISFGAENFPNNIFVDSSGRFLYVLVGINLNIYSIDQTTGQPTPLSIAPLALNSLFFMGQAVADPAGPFIYAVAGSGTGIAVFQVSPTDGSLTEIAGSPFSAGGSPAHIAISGTASQPISGPSAAFTSLSLSFGSVTESRPVTFVDHLVNNGDQTLTINLAATSITGTNATDFSQSSTCPAALAPNANCSFSVTFSPSAVGPETALLSISDNAPGSPQTIPLSGTGVAPAPSVAFSPGSLTFSAIAQGVTESPQTIQLTNIGSATLHISAVALGGANPGDFSATNNCTTAALAINASCTVTVSFTPQATGTRSASVTFTDDANNSPQTVFIQWTGTTAFQINPSPQSSTAASVTAGQTAQYNLQLTPGTGFTGNISIACTGAPTAATCSLSPASLSVTSANPVAFTAKITTSGASSAASPLHTAPPQRWRFTPTPIAPIAALLLLWILSKRKTAAPRFVTAFALFLFCVCGTAMTGCGGAYSSPPPPPPPLITPKGNYVVTVTATAGSLPPQTLSLTLTVN